MLVCIDILNPCEIDAETPQFCHPRIRNSVSRLSLCTTVSHPKLIFWLLLFYCIVYDNIYMRNFAPLHALSLFLAGVPHKDDEMSLMMLPMMKWWRMNECIIIYFYIYIYFYCVQIRCRRSMARLYKPSIAMRQWTNRKSNINTTSTGGRR